MGAPNTALVGLVARMRSVASLLIDGQPSSSQGPRIGKFGEVYGVHPLFGDRALVDEGSLFTATMTPGQTALQLGLSAAFSATAAALVIKNNAPAGKVGSPNLIMRHIHMVVVTAPTAGTSLRYATVLDSGPRTPTTVSPVASPATVTAYSVAPCNSNMDAEINSVAQVYFPLSIAAGAPPTIPGAVNARTVIGNGHLRGQIPVAEDDYRIIFGQDGLAGGSLVTAAPAGASRVVEPHPAVEIGPQQFFIFYLWAPSNITAGLAFSGLDVGWIER
jgi:hypothetical protein